MNESLKKIIFHYKKSGFFYLIKKIKNRIFPERAKSFTLCKEFLQNRSGLEIGGPSKIFSSKGLLPIYGLVKNLDNCNYASSTLWEGEIKSGYTFQFHRNKKNGYQYILEATELQQVESEKYDFILASHIIEHIANPLKALNEWKRVLKNGAKLLIIFPHKEGTFDHNRSTTELNHIIDDFKNNIPESDLFHLEEILLFHDLERDPDAGSFEDFKARCQKNYIHRSMHHHVFTTLSAVELLNYAGFKIFSVETVRPFHIIILAGISHDVDNKKIIKNLLENKIASPFAADNHL